MPELPEVRTVVKYLNEAVTGKTISKATFYYNKLLRNTNMAHFSREVVGQTINNVFPRGKYIIFELDNYEMISHLRMEGKWCYEPIELYTYAQSWMELQFSFKGDDKHVLRYYDSRKFGTLDLILKDGWKEYAKEKGLGPEPWDKEMTPEYLYSKFQKSRKAIKTELLDQHVILGIGNIYADEILFASKLDPRCPSNKVSFEETKIILKNTQNILTIATKNGGTTIHSFAYGPKNAGNYQDKLMIHNPGQKKCKICGSTIAFIKVNGRGTYFCPSCQKMPKS